MAKSMIKRRQEAERERLEAYQATLQRTVRAERATPDFQKALYEAQWGFAERKLRSCMEWRPKLKTRDPAKLRLAAARHLFAQYPVCRSLERIWLETEGLDAREIALRKRWYIAAARGESLYKAQAGEWLSRKEVHAFLNPPGDLSFEGAFWAAIARSYTDDLGAALRIARSKVAKTPRDQLGFWREAVRFFAVNVTTLEEMDDLCDYLAAHHRRDKAYSLKGRTLASLRRQMQEWHRDLAAVARIEQARMRAEHAAAMARGGDRSQERDPGRWAGSPLADWAWKPSAREASNRREEFVVAQLVSADELVAEGRAMHHCVWSYAQKCIAGQASIWSLRRRMPGRVDRLLTIELDRQNRAVQVRGFANRLANADEKQVIGRWAKAKGIGLLV